jgi:hypothetical protein
MSLKANNNLLNQAKLCLDNKRFDDRSKSLSLKSNSSISDDANVQERRQVFARSRASMAFINQSEESKIFDSTNRVIVHTSNSIATSNKLYDRRKLISEELHKLKQARIHNHYVKYPNTFCQKILFFFSFRSLSIDHYIKF